MPKLKFIAAMIPEISVLNENLGIADPITSDSITSVQCSAHMLHVPGCKVDQIRSEELQAKKPSTCIYFTTTSCWFMGAITKYTHSSSGTVAGGN